MTLIHSGLIDCIAIIAGDSLTSHPVNSLSLVVGWRLMKGGRGEARYCQAGRALPSPVALQGDERGLSSCLSEQIRRTPSGCTCELREEQGNVSRDAGWY